uniref:Tyrosinase copper-binding domain-containing protein n=1 Tax=Panagrolaimus sp. PS1159 TaxID=55785 RepID=A0AC35FDD3_9BILA
MSRIKIFHHNNIPVQLVNIKIVLLSLFIFYVNLSYANLPFKHNDKSSSSSIDLLPNCDDLPHADFLSTQQLDLICEHRKMWFMDRESKISKEFIDHTTDSQNAYFKSLERCSKDDTECQMIKKGSSKQRRHERGIPQNQNRRVTRKEYRMLTENERKNLNEAMNALKSKYIDNVTIWDLHTLIHYPDSAPGAHWGPAFLPWHREFLRQFEVALQREVPGVALPYWDSTIDNGLPDPSDSVLWTDELMGNGNGYVKTGPFHDWDTNVLMPLSPVPVKKLYRFVLIGPFLPTAY